MSLISEIEKILKEYKDAYNKIDQLEKQHRAELQLLHEKHRTPADEKFNAICFQIREQLSSRGWIRPKLNPPRFWNTVTGKNCSLSSWENRFGLNWEAWPSLKKCLETTAEDDWQSALGLSKYKIKSIRPIDGSYYSREKLVSRDEMSFSQAQRYKRFFRDAGKTSQCFFVELEKLDKLDRSAYIGELISRDHKLLGVAVAFGGRTDKIQIENGGESTVVYYECKKELQRMFKRDASDFQKKITDNPVVYLLDSDPYIRWFAETSHKNKKAK